jgi:hypothetical protein
MARNSLFLFFTNILQRFELKSPQGSKLEIEPIVGFIHMCPNYDLEMVDRTDYPAPMTTMEKNEE